MVVKKYMTMTDEGEENEEEGTWDSMAVIASETWNEGNPDEIGLTREKLLPKGYDKILIYLSLTDIRYGHNSETKLNPDCSILIVVLLF